MNPTVQPSREAVQPVREFVANVASRLHHVETHWVPEDRATPMPFVAVMAVFDQALAAHDAEVVEEYRRLDGYTEAVRDIALERATHVERGWTTQHDDEEGPRNLIGYAAERINDASAWLAISPGSDPTDVNRHVRSQLVKAASLLVAAVELMDRADPYEKAL